MRLSSPRSILGALTLAAGLAGVSALTLTFSGCQGTTPDDLPTGTNSTGLIFVKSTNSRTVDINFVPSRGSDLFSLKPISPNGELRNLTASLKGAVADPEISYDGLKVLFALRSDPGDRWHIHEMNVDGANLRQLTNDPDRDDCDPAYLPNGKIVFCSNRPNYRDEYNRRPVEVMHTMNPDGSDIQCISFNNSDDFDPIVLRDGRVAWTRWDHHGAQNRFPLFLTKPDGRSTFLLFGPHNRNFFHPRELEDGNLVAVVSTRVLKDTGPLAILKSTQTTSDPPEDDDFKVIHEGAFKYPHPLPDGRLLASYAPGGEESNFGLYTLNRDGSNLSLLYDDPEAHELDAVVVAPRPKPPVIPERIDRSATSGVFINENVYFRQTKEGQRVPEPGEVKQVMVIEGIRVTPGERNINIGMTSFERKRVLGVTPVYEDGSFAIRVPANTPISFNSLDSLGRAVVIKRNWIYARPGESFENCTGCHGPRGMPSNPNPIARHREPTDLDIPVEQRQVFSFRNALEPIVQQKCLPCHGGETPDARLNLSLAKTADYSTAYESLMSASREPRLVNVSSVPFSRKSRLIDVLLGIGDRENQGAHPSGDQALTPGELRKFITWVDLGGQYW